MYTPSVPHYFLVYSSITRCMRQYITGIWNAPSLQVRDRSWYAYWRMMQSAIHIVGSQFAFYKLILVKRSVLFWMRDLVAVTRWRKLRSFFLNLAALAHTESSGCAAVRLMHGDHVVKSCDLPTVRPSVCLSAWMGGGYQGRKTLHRPNDAIRY